MSDVEVVMLDGEVKLFREERRPGGSYRNTVKYETGFVIITDVWGKSVSIASHLIKELHFDDVN